MALASARRQLPAYGPHATPDRVAALRAMTRQDARRYAVEGQEFSISSAHYGPAEVESVAATLRSLDHGPEIAELSVYVATPEEISSLCGATVVACYVPAGMEMIVSGVDRPVDGVPRDFAIAHEYGHHIANTRGASGPFQPLDAGTIRWATYERVCQLTRQHRLFPGNQGAHYWQDPEEAFAQSYAHLSRPQDGVSWQYTSLLAPDPTALAKIHADVAHPWQGPVTRKWSGLVSASPRRPGPGHTVRRGRAGLAGGHSVGPRPWVAGRLLRTPLDGAVSLTVEANGDSPLQVEMLDPSDGRVLARGVASPGAPASLGFTNCGRSAIRLQVRNLGGGESGFSASVSRP